LTDREGQVRLLFLGFFVVIMGWPVCAPGWSFEVLGETVYFDMAVGSDGTPHIVHTNCTDRELCFGTPMPRYLIHTAKRGGLWTHDTPSVDPAGFTPAIALDDSGGVHIAYVDSLLDLHYVYAAPGGPWAKESLPHSHPSFFRNEPAIALDDTGAVHISYNQGERLWYQCRSDTGWTEEQVTYNTSDNDISRSSIQVGSDGIVRIACWSFETDGVLYEKIGGVWTQNVIGGERGQYPSLQLDASNAAHILYIGTGGVAYATNETGAWTEEVLDPNGSYGDIILADDEMPIVVYSTALPVFDGVWFYDVDLYLSVEQSGFWQRRSLASHVTPVFGGVGFDFRPRLAIDEENVLHIAYTDPTTGNLVYGYCDVAAALDPPPVTGPGQPYLRAVPNPFNASTTLHYSVPFAGRVRIDVFEVGGKHVRTLVDGELGEGPQTTLWDARSDDGTAVSSGVYYVRFESTAGIVTQRAVHVK
jgi:hypothetical protein